MVWTAAQQKSHFDTGIGFAMPPIVGAYHQTKTMAIGLA
jgi:hypothetical protein